MEVEKFNCRFIDFEDMVKKGIVSKSNLISLTPVDANLYSVIIWLEDKKTYDLNDLITIYNELEDKNKYAIQTPSNKGWGGTDILRFFKTLIETLKQN